MSAGCGAIAVANTLLMAARSRRSDLRVLRLAGATRRQVASTVAAESALVVLIGSVLGGVLGLRLVLAVSVSVAVSVTAKVRASGSVVP